MTNLNVRKLPDRVAARLRVRAARAGRSMEAEAREILSQASLGRGRASGPADLQRFVDTLYRNKKPSGVVKELLAERRREARRE